jgi:serine/threonine protein kinase
MLTPGFAPIEQYSNRAKRGTFTDIYALGATLYFLLTGHKPLAATDRYREQLAAPHQINPAVSEQLSSAVMMAMEMKEEDRFQHIGDFRAAMTLLAKGKQENHLKEENEQKTLVKNLLIDPKLKSTQKIKQKRIWVIDWIVVFLGGVSVIGLFYEILSYFLTSYINTGYIGSTIAALSIGSLTLSLLIILLKLYKKIIFRINLMSLILGLISFLGLLLLENVYKSFWRPCWRARTFCFKDDDRELIRDGWKNKTISLDSLQKLELKCSKFRELEDEIFSIEMKISDLNTDSILIDKLIDKKRILEDSLSHIKVN